MTDKHDGDRMEPVADSAEPIAYGGISPEAKAKAEQLKAKLAAALDAAPQAAVVKPLAWVKHPSADIWRVDTIIGTYKVFGTGPSPSWDFDGLTEKVSHVCMIVDEGFSAAQAHHDARIFSAINFTPSQLSAAAAYERAAAAINSAREGVIHSGERQFIDGVRLGHDRSEAAIRALSAEIPAADLIKAARALPEVREKFARDIEFLFRRGISPEKWPDYIRVPAALARLKGSQI